MSEPVSPELQPDIHDGGIAECAWWDFCHTAGGGLPDRVTKRNP